MEEVLALIEKIIEEHKLILQRFHTLEQVVNDASAYDMRAHISHTRKLLQAHTEIEQELLRKLRNQLRRENKRK